MTMPGAAGRALEPVPGPGHIPLEVTWYAQRYVAASRLATGPRPEFVRCWESRASSANPASHFLLDILRHAMCPCVRDAFSPNIGQTFKLDIVGVAGQRAGA